MCWMCDRPVRMVCSDALCECGRQGFGSYFEADVENGLCVAVRARKDPETGVKKVIKAQMLIGHLLEMAAGEKTGVPKGGHAADIAARRSPILGSCIQVSPVPRLTPAICFDSILWRCGAPLCE